MKMLVEWICPNCKEQNVHRVDLGDLSFSDPHKVCCEDEDKEGCGRVYFLELRPTVEVKVLELRDAL